MGLEERLANIVKPELKDAIEQIEERKYDRSKCAVPFVPYVGHNYTNAKVKTLIVGKATEGWGWEDSKSDKDATLEKFVEKFGEANLYENLAKLPRRFIEKRIIPYYGGKKNCKEGYCSNFWNRIYRLVGALLFEGNVRNYERDLEMSERCFSSIAWTNVFKLSKIRGNPGRELVSIQERSDLLHKEIKVLAPDIVLFSTGRAYDKHLRKCLPNLQGMTSVRAAYPRIEKVDGIDGVGKVALRTKHLQAMSNREFEQVVEYLGVVLRL